MSKYDIQTCELVQGRITIVDDSLRHAPMHRVLSKRIWVKSYGSSGEDGEQRDRL